MPINEAQQKAILSLVRDGQERGLSKGQLRSEARTARQLAELGETIPPPQNLEGHRQKLLVDAARLREELTLRQSHGIKGFFANLRRVAGL